MGAVNKGATIPGPIMPGNNSWYMWNSGEQWLDLDDVSSSYGRLPWNESQNGVYQHLGAIRTPGSSLNRCGSSAQITEGIESFLDVFRE